MPIQMPAVNGARKLAEVLERQIDQRTDRRVRQLRVDAAGGRVVIHGFTSSYYVKQLVLAAVQEVADPEQVEMDVQVR